MEELVMECNKNKLIALLILSWLQHVTTMG